jgi:hypothetical protein
MGQKDLLSSCDLVSNLVPVQICVWYTKPDTYYQCYMLHLSHNIFTELNIPECSKANLQVLTD